MPDARDPMEVAAEAAQAATRNRPFSWMASTRACVLAFLEALEPGEIAAVILDAQGFVLDGRDSLIAQCDKLDRLFTLAESALTARSEALREAAEIARDEPEALGEIPDELRMAPPEDVVRAAIRATKSNIATAILARIQEKNNA